MSNETIIKRVEQARAEARALHNEIVEVVIGEICSARGAYENALVEKLRGVVRGVVRDEIAKVSRRRLTGRGMQKV